MSEKKPLLLIAICLALASGAMGQESQQPLEADKVMKHVRTPTLGGGKYWLDVGEVEGFRVQKYKFLQLYRLLDPANVLITWGPLDKCQDSLASELAAEPDKQKENLNVPGFTMGGKQFWGDVLIYGNWRIQRNVFTGHFRLLNPRDMRQTWGSFQQCRNRLEQEKEKGAVKLSSRRLCLLVHGVLRSKDSFNKLHQVLTAAGYQVYSVNYPSSRQKIEDHAKQMIELIGNIEEDFDELYFVTHSLGGLVMRKTLSEGSNQKVKRLVMLAPPNQGAMLADIFLDWRPYKLIWGPAGEQMITGAESFATGAGIPSCEFGIIAGIAGEKMGGNPLIEGMDDGVVGVEATKLAGMKDHLTVPSGHSFIMNKPQVINQIMHFFDHGEFNHADEQTTNREQETRH